MRNVKIDFQVRMEGIEIPANKFSIISQKNVPCYISLDLMSVPEIKNVLPDTIIEIFWRVNEGEYKFMIDANVSGKNIRKISDTYERIIVGMQFINKVNEVPFRYIDLMAPTTIPDFEYRFINMDDRTKKNTIVGRTLKSGADWGLGEDITYKFKDRPVEKYFNQFIDYTIGGSAWEPYYENIGKRLQIKNNLAIVDSWQFYKIYQAQTFVKMILQQVSSMKRGYVLDELMKVFIDTGYSFLSPASPPFNKTKLADLPNKLLFYSNAKSVLKHVITPDLVNCIPPRCNVIFAGKGSNISIKIDDKPITRLLNKFLWKPSDNSPLYCSVYPPELTGNVDAIINPFINNKKADYSLMDDEKISGMNAVVQNKNYLFSILMNREDVPTVKEVNKNGIEVETVVYDDVLQGKLNKITEYDFYKLKYINNKISVDIPEFLPYLVSGLPALLYDPDVDEFYYGEITYLNYNVDLGGGFISTSIVMQNAREIDDIRDIIGKRIELDSGKHEYKYVKMSPYLPPHFNPFQNSGINLDGEHLSYISKEYYKKILGGTGDKFGWASVVDVTVINTKTGEDEIILPENVLPYIKTKYDEGKQDLYVERNVATMYEYYSTVLNDYDPPAATEHIPKAISEQLKTMRENVISVDDISKKITSNKRIRYVKERRDVISGTENDTGLKAALKKVEIYDA